MRESSIIGAPFRFTSKALRLTALLPMVVLLGGCAIGPQVKELPASYDLGPQRAYVQENPRIRTVLLLPVVSAPAWLDGSGIIYRDRKSVV